MSAQVGFYKARAVEGSQQLGLSDESNQPQVAIDLLVTTGEVIPDGPQGARAGQFRITTALSFSEKARQFSIDRLKACGWDGVDVRALNGIGANEVDVELFHEEFQGRKRVKCEIRTAGATFKLKFPMKESDREAFADDLAKVMNSRVKR